MSYLADTVRPFDPCLEELLECSNVWEHRVSKASARRPGDKARDPVLPGPHPWGSARRTVTTGPGPEVQFSCTWVRLCQLSLLRRLLARAASGETIRFGGYVKCQVTVNEHHNET
jgi:hypothetical protein